MTVLGQPTVNYTYDNADRLTQITQGSATVSMAYDNANRRTSLTLPNGVVTEYAYDAASRLTGLTYKLGSTPLGTLTYSYDANGNRTVLGGTWARTGLPTTLASATYNAANHQLTFGSMTLTYDLNGNLTSDGTTTYSWDARNRLVAISGGSAASFQYDAQGRRTSKTINSAQTGFLYDGLTPVQELNGSSVVANLLTGLGIDEYLTRTDAGGASHFISDALGSTVALSDAVGALPTSYTYAPFGAPSLSGSATGSSFDYTGRENDGTGLHYYRARYYHSGLGRFVSEDPIEFAGGDVNLYSYVANDPVGKIDPDGKIAVQIVGGIIGAGFGAYAAYTTGGSILQSALVGGAAGVLSTIPIPGINPVLGSLVASGTAAFLGNVGTQVVIQGKAFRCVDLTSAGLSGVAGAVGGGVGAKIATMTQPAFLAPSAAGRGPILTQYGQSMIGAILAGVIGGAGDAVAQSALAGRNCGCSQ
jgi:RHS repeat-associated protein